MAPRAKDEGCPPAKGRKLRKGTRDKQTVEQIRSILLFSLPFKRPNTQHFQLRLAACPLVIWAHAHVVLEGVNLALDSHSSCWVFGPLFRGILRNLHETKGALERRNSESCSCGFLGLLSCFFKTIKQRGRDGIHRQFLRNQ